VTTVSPKRAIGPLILALDVGTSSVRAEPYDARGRLIRDQGAQLPCPVRTTADGGVEMDPDELFEQTARVLDEALARAPDLPGPIAAVATTTFWHSVLGVGADGRATTPLYLWADSRSREAMAELRGRLDERAVHARTGCVLHWSYWPAKLVWLSRADPVRFRRTRTWMSFGEYFQRRVFGRTVCSLSMASGTGLLDQNARAWDGGVLGALPISAEQLAPLGDLDAPLREPGREYARRWPSLRDVPWYPAVGDGGCSNVGSGCVTRERMALMVGTSGALRVAWRAERATIPWGGWCYRIDGRRFVMGGALTNGGNLFAWMRRTLKLGSIPDAERELARMEPDAHGLTVLPFLAGERSPGYAAHAQAAILGLDLATRPIDILRAGLEAIALRFALLHDILKTEAPEVRQVIATGGGLLRSPAWVQMMADALGRPVVASGEPEASSRGAALLALESLGAIPDVATVPAATGRVYEPDPAHHARYQEAQQRHRRYYRLLVAD
jgi:gluconokinase